MSIFKDRLNGMIGGDEFYTLLGGNMVKAKVVAFADDMVTLKIKQENGNLNLTMHYSNVVFVSQ